MLKLTNITKTFSTKDIETEVLKGINIEIKNGEFLGVIGRSGSGKSTLLNIMGLIDNPTSGSYYLNNENVINVSNNKKAEIRNKSVGYIFQSFHLIDDLKVGENVAMPLGYYGINKKNRLNRAKDLLRQVGLEDKIGVYPSKLSGGEKQRIAIARALSNNPEIILADEPTGSLDLKNAIEIMEILTNLNKKGITIIMVTHDISLTKYMSRVVKMEEGYLIEKIS